MHDEDEDLPAPLRDATRLLREPPSIRDEWRRGIQSQIARSRTPWLRRPWSVSPIAAIAAGLVCVAAGGLAVDAVRHTSVIANASAPETVSTDVALPASAPRVKFDLVAPGAARVSIAGDFNQWNAASLPMHRAADGRTWEIEVRLPPGRYTYGFVVDGRLTRDPSAPQAAGDDFGVPNSVRLVSRAGASL